MKIITNIYKELERHTAVIIDKWECIRSTKNQHKERENNEERDTEPERWMVQVK